METGQGSHDGLFYSNRKGNSLVLGVTFFGRPMPQMSTGYHTIVAQFPDLTCAYFIEARRSGDTIGRAGTFQMTLNDAPMVSYDSLSGNRKEAQCSG